MGLIEKAIGVSSLGDGQGVQSPRRRTSPSAATEFDVDFKALAAQGFYTPTARSTPLALELRAIKRRLLRRIGFFNRGVNQRALQQSGRQRNLILVTSTRPAEGKTFSAINLALSLACEEDIEVLLVDADTPRPKVRSHFGLPESAGLTDRLMDPTINIEELATRSRQIPLSILSEGVNVDRPGDLLGSADAQRVFTELSTARNDRLVIVDAPPVLATTEAVVLARHVDEIVFVVEADATPEPAVAAALDEILEVCPNVSLVLNRCLLAGGGTHYGSYERYENTRSEAATQPIQRVE